MTTYVGLWINHGAMRHTILLLATVAALTLAAADRIHENKLQQGIDLLETKGDLPAAISTFEEVSKSSDRSLAARALLYLGSCYQKLGEEKAQSAYERIVREFADQKEAAAEARTRLASLRRSPDGYAGIVTRQVWTGRNVDVLGSVAPDGRFLAFIDWDSGDLAIRNLATGENRRLTNNQSWDSPSHAGFAEFAKISPDGKQIAYDWLNKASGWELRVISVDGARGRVLYKNAEVVYPLTSGWSPDGKHVVAGFSRADGTNQIALISLADGSARALKTTDWREPQNMAFSPDGNYIVYDFPPREDTPERDIYLLAADGSREIRLVEHPAHDMVLGWTPDGRHVLFASDRRGTNDAWAIAVAEGKPQASPELVKRDLGKVFPLGFTRAGSYFYGLATGMVDVRTAALDWQTGKVSRSPERVAQRFIGGNYSPDWSPDGRSLIYVSGRGRHSTAAESRVLCVASLETGQQRDLPLKLTYISKPRWAPDNRTVVVRARGEKQRPGLFLVDTQTGSATHVVQSQEVRDFAWSRDGKAIFYSRKRPGTPGEAAQVVGQLLLRVLDTGEEKEIFRVESASGVGDGILNDLAVSPDGRSLAFTTIKTGEPKTIMVIPVEGGPTREIYRVPKNGPGIPNFTGLEWTPDGQQLLFVTGGGQNLQTPGPGNRDLWSVRATGGEPRRLGLSMLGLREVRVAPGGKQIAFTAGEDRSEVWAMENLQPVLRSGR